MAGYGHHIIGQFWVAGVSYQKADTAVRSRFSLAEAKAQRLIAQAKERGLDSVLVLSTCNRVEVYGFAQHGRELVELLLENCPEGNFSLFETYGYCYRGEMALTHLFRVGAGLASQILGDYEIVGQLKQSLRRSTMQQAVGPLLNRIMCNVLEASKKIKNQTALSKGTASVSFAAVEWLRQQTNLAHAAILLIGAGSFGKTVLKNIRHYCPEARLSLSNRTPEKALFLCRQSRVSLVDFTTLPQVLDTFDVIICCTSAPAPLIGKHHITAGKKKWIMDLSVPANVCADVGDLDRVTLVNVDEISRMVNQTMTIRQQEVEKANAIIAEQVEAFLGWAEDRRHFEAITHFRENLVTMAQMHLVSVTPAVIGKKLAAPVWEKAINHKTAHLVKSIQKHRNKGCQLIMAYHSFLSSPLVAAAHA